MSIHTCKCKKEWTVTGPSFPYHLDYYQCQSGYAFMYVDEVLNYSQECCWHRLALKNWLCLCFEKYAGAHTW
jgi:hypothetical protein